MDADILSLVVCYGIATVALLAALYWFRDSMDFDSFVGLVCAWIAAPILVNLLAITLILFVAGVAFITPLYLIFKLYKRLI